MFISKTYLSQSTLKTETLDMYLVSVTKDRPVTGHVLGPKSDILSKHVEVFIMNRTASFHININLPFNIKINLQSINTNRSSTKLCLIFYNSRPAIIFDATFWSVLKVYEFQKHPVTSIKVLMSS